MLIVHIDHIGYGTTQYTPILQKIHFQCPSGSIIGICGHTGSGKSTLLRSLCGLNYGSDIRVNGNVVLDDVSYSLKSLELRNLNKQEFSYFFQQVSSSFNPNRTIGYHFTDFHFKRLDLKKVVELLRSLSLEDTRTILESYPDQLSGGELQRVAMAMMLYKEPRVILFDEPFVSLDRGNISILKNILFKCKESGNIIIIASHLLDELGHVCDKLYRISNQTMSAYKYHSFSKSNLTNKKRVESQKGAAICIVENVSFSYKGRKEEVLSHINLKIGEGDFILLHGDSGSGKSTLLKLISGELQPDEGQIYNGISGRSLAGLGLGHLWKRNIGRDDVCALYVSQLTYESFPSFDSGYSILKKLGMWQKSQLYIEEFCTLLQFPIECFYERNAKLSGGQRQVVLLLIAMSLFPRIILLDEVLAGMDADRVRNFLGLLSMYRKKYHISIVMVSHQNQNELLELSEIYELP